MTVYKLSMVAFVLQEQTWLVVTEIFLFHKLKMFIIWLFQKKFAIPCFLKSSSFLKIYTKRMLKEKWLLIAIVENIQ